MGAGANVVSAGFDWGVVGSVVVRTIRYKAFFDQGSDSLNSKMPNNKVTDSQLSWVNKEFTLEDLKTIDLETGKSVEFPSLQARFCVTDNEEFGNLIDTEGLINNFEMNVKKKLSKERKHKVLENVSQKCREFWNYSRGMWLRNAGLISKKSVKHAGTECFEINLVKDAEKSSIVEFLDKKYEPDRIGEVMHRVKGKMVVEKVNMRPHLVFVRKSSYAEIEKDNRAISEVSEDMIVIIYCWDEIPVLASNEFVKSEVRKMNEIVKYVANEFNQKERHKLKSKILKNN